MNLIGSYFKEVKNRKFSVDFKSNEENKKKKLGKTKILCKILQVFDEIDFDFLV